MKTPDSLNDVSLFHKTFKHPVLETPQIPSKARADLRISLLQEELNELKEAIQNNDLVEVADAFCDIQYVLAGAILEFGMGDKFETLFNEVQRSNMSKTCKTLEEAQLTQKHYLENKGQSSRIEKSGNHYLVFREPDNKTLKSINYSPADLSKILK